MCEVLCFLLFFAVAVITVDVVSDDCEEPAQPKDPILQPGLVGSVQPSLPPSSHFLLKKYFKLNYSKLSNAVGKVGKQEY